MICISFDTDHINEQRMKEFLKIVDFPGLGTFFCTEVYESLKETDHEVAPHPYLNELGVDWEQKLTFSRNEFPNAVGWRAHSCLFSHILAEWLGKNHYKYVSVYDDLGNCDIKPVKNPWGIWQLPIYYMDNLDFSQNRFWNQPGFSPFERNIITNAVSGNGLCVFDFHPIHILLNTPSVEHYFSVRERFILGEQIDNLCHKGYGTASFFRDLCIEMKKNNQSSITMKNALDHYINI